MEAFKDILYDSLLDALKLLPFLLLAFLLIELIEHYYSDKSKDIVSKSGKVGPLVGGLLGAIPQCGFSVLATNLYVTRLITLGTLLAIYLSTSDEMIAVLLSNKFPISSVLIIVGIKVVIGIICGFLIDLVYRKKKKEVKIDICEECDCEHSLILASVKHALKTLASIFIVILTLNILFYFLNEDAVNAIFMKSSVFSPMVSSLIGLIPNCGSSVLITELYVQGVINFGSLLSGLLVNSGVGILVLFRSNKNIKENLFILLLLYLIGVLFGTIFLLLGVTV